MREKTVVGLYDRFADAQAAVADVIGSGVGSEKISLLANNRAGDHPALAVNPAFAGEEFDIDSHEQSSVVTGAEVGIGVGGLLGFLLGISTIAIPGFGFLLAAGTWATVGAGAATGGVIGAIVGKLTDHGVSDKDAHLYAEGLKRGGTLVTVVVLEADTAAIHAIFEKHGAVDIEGRAAPWNPEGWVGFAKGAIPAFNLGTIPAASGGAAASPA